MRTEHEDKSIAPQAHKGFSGAAHAAYQRQMDRVANQRVPPEAANEIGRAVAVDLEAAAQRNYMPALRKAVEPTADELAEEARALAAYDAAVTKRDATAREAQRLELELRIAQSPFGSGVEVSFAERIALEGRKAAAGVKVRAFDEDVDRTSRALSRIRGRMVARARGREIRFVGRGF
jgi:hypothetical protein